MRTSIQGKKNDYLRSCSFCGRLVLRSTMVKKDGYLACKDDAKGRERLTLDKLNAAALKPRRWRPAKDRLSDRDNELDVFQADEAIIFNAISNNPTVQFCDLTGRKTSDPAHIIGRFRATGYQARALYQIIAENKRPAAVVNRAKTLLVALANSIVSGQNISGDPSSNLLYGYLNIGTGYMDAEAQSICGWAVLGAWLAIGTMSYYTAAVAFAHSLRNLQSSAYAPVFTSSDSGGTSPLYTGGWSHGFDVSGSRYDHRFYPGDLIGAEFLTALKAVAGDISIGATATIGFFSQVPSTSITTCINDALNFWRNGVLESSSVSTVNGLSAVSPRELFNAFPANKQSAIFTMAGTGNWEYADGDYTTGSTVNALNTAKGLHALWSADGFSAQVTAFWNYLQALGADATFATPAGASDYTLYRSATGTFDPTLAPPTQFNARTAKNATSFYDWGAWGILADLQTAKNAGKFTAARTALGVKRYRYRDGTDNDVPLDHVGLVGTSGLSYQTSFAAFADLERASMVEGAYRVSPTIFPMSDR